jgi:hypothetical protein
MQRQQQVSRLLQAFRHVLTNEGASALSGSALINGLGSTTPAASGPAAAAPLQLVSVQAAGGSTC